MESAHKEAYARAIKLLARREHSQHELLVKLGKAGFDEVSIDTALNKLVDNGYQSDQRFAELFVQQRFNKGYGERDILAKLGQRGIVRHLAGSVLAEFVSGENIDWYAQAAAVLSARFDLSQASVSVTDAADNGEQMSAESRRASAYEQSSAHQRRRKQWGNYLLRRGFSNDQVIYAIDNPGNLENDTDAG